MEKEETSSSPFNINTLLLLLTVAGGILFASEKLSSDRPAGSAHENFEHLGDQRVASRLWEDPFSSLEKEKVDGREFNEMVSLDALTEIISNQCSNASSPLLVLPVMLPGGSYSEDRESRIRTRVAVVSALGASGYAPED